MPILSVVCPVCHVDISEWPLAESVSECIELLGQLKRWYRTRKDGGWNKFKLHRSLTNWPYCSGSVFISWLICVYSDAGFDVIMSTNLGWFWPGVRFQGRDIKQREGRVGTGEEWLGSPLIWNIICIRILYFWDWRGKPCNINTFFWMRMLPCYLVVITN